MKPHKQDEVEISHRVNKLKKKVAAPGGQHKTGSINPGHITEAQSVIETSQENYTKALSSAIESLEEIWTKTSHHNDEENKSTLQEIHRYANFIKDIASTYNHELMCYFGQSLRDLTDKINIASKAHRTIVKAHIDVMRLTLQNDIKTDKETLAKELKLTLEKAINKHFPASGKVDFHR